MTIRSCTQSSGGITATTQWTSVQALNQTSVLSSAPPPGSFIGTIAWEGGGSLLSSFQAQLVLMSGPGPVYTDEVVLVSYLGDHGLNNGVDGSLSETAILPHAGRPFNWQTDAVAFRHNTGFTGASSSSIVHIYFQLCSGEASTVDCCAELNSKLDQLIQYVSQVYANAP